MKRLGVTLNEGPDMHRELVAAVQGDRPWGNELPGRGALKRRVVGRDRVQRVGTGFKEVACKVMKIGGANTGH